ncbi:nuclear transport factor 2 family protein [Streptomyces sp. NPDC020096]
MSAITEVTQLVLHERQARDRSWWDQMRECFTPDSTVRLSWFRGSGADFVTGSQQMAEKGDATTHRLSPPTVDVHGSRAFVELPAAIEMRTTLDGTQVDLTSHARLLYRAERRADRWQIVSLDPVYERDTLVPSVPDTTLKVDRAALAEYRPPYRMLSYVFGRLGYDVSDDLYGDDRREQVAELYRSAFIWLRG